MGMNKGKVLQNFHFHIPHPNWSFSSSKIMGGLSFACFRVIRAFSEIMDPNISKQRQEYLGCSCKSRTPHLK